MNLSHPLTSGVLAVALAVAASAPLFVLAEDSLSSPIMVESRESNVTFQPPIDDDSSFPFEGQSTGGIEGQYQLQLLQQEVMELRGVVEQLQYELNRLKTVSDDRYLELDSRLQQLMSSRGTALPEVGQVDNPAGDSPLTATEGELGEKELYDTTQQLIRNRQYDVAIAQLESLIDRFPDGTYAPNAYYWLGQVYAAKTNPDFEKARQALAQVISFFPDHAKVPDAAYALGKVYYALGDCDRAVELLQQVVDQYPGKSAATLAENYLRESVNCGT